MNKNQGSNAGLFWVIGVIAASMVIFVYIVVSDSPRTLPKIDLSYFSDEQEVAQSVTKRLSQEISASNNSYWIGLEPEKPEQTEIAVKLKEALEKNSPFQKVIVDEELLLKDPDLQRLGATEHLLLKENITGLGKDLASYEKNKVPYLVITAAIYSTSLLPGNPIRNLKEKFSIKPITFSLGYFAVDQKDETNLLFPCNSEDHSGIKDWGCFVTSKARSVRRKLNSKNQKAWVGLMDLSGENDYIILLKKK